MTKHLGNTNIKMTRPRQIVMDLLRDHPDPDWPAFSASNIRFCLKDTGVDIHPKAIHRTLKELWEAGLVVAHRVKTDGTSDSLPRWELHFEPCEAMMANYRRQRISQLELFIRRRTSGLGFFGKTWVDPWAPGDKEHVTRELESLMAGGIDDLGELMAWRAQIVTAGSNIVELKQIIQANHPDRPGGDPELAKAAISEMKRLKKASRR